MSLHLVSDQFFVFLEGVLIFFNNTLSSLSMTSPLGGLSHIFGLWLPLHIASALLLWGPYRWMKVIRLHCVVVWSCIEEYLMSAWSNNVKGPICLGYGVPFVQGKENCYSLTRPVDGVETEVLLKIDVMDNKNFTQSNSSLLNQTKVHQR